MFYGERCYALLVFLRGRINKKVSVKKRLNLIEFESMFYFGHFFDFSFGIEFMSSGQSKKNNCRYVKVLLKRNKDDLKNCSVANFEDVFRFLCAILNNEKCPVKFPGFAYKFIGTVGYEFDNLSQLIDILQFLKCHSKKRFLSFWLMVILFHDDNIEELSILLSGIEVDFDDQIFTQKTYLLIDLHKSSFSKLRCCQFLYDFFVLQNRFKDLKVYFCFTLLKYYVKKVFPRGRIYDCASCSLFEKVSPILEDCEDVNIYVNYLMLIYSIESNNFRISTYLENCGSLSSGSSKPYFYASRCVLIYEKITKYKSQSDCYSYYRSVRSFIFYMLEESCFEFEAFNSILSKYFKLLLPDLYQSNNYFFEEIASYLYSGCNYKIKLDSHLEFLEFNLIESISHNFKFYEFLNLHALLWRFGYIEFSYKIRCCSKRSLVNCNSELFYSLFRIHSLLDDGDLYSAYKLFSEEFLNDDVLTKTNNNYINSSLIDLMEYFCFLGFNHSSTHEARDNYTSDLFHNKNVAIVGSSSLNQSDMNDLAESETIVFINKVDIDILKSIDGCEKKIVVALSSSFGDFLSQEAIDSLNKCETVIVPKSRYSYFKDLLSCNVLSRSLKLDLYSGSLNQGIAIVYFVLRFLPECCKIYGMNFYLSDNIYREGYSNFSNSQSIVTLKTLLLQVQHDNLSNMKFVKALMTRLPLLLDSKAQYVIDLDDETYIKKMQHIVLMLSNQISFANSDR